MAWLVSGCSSPAEPKDEIFILSLDQTEVTLTATPQITDSGGAPVGGAWQGQVHYRAFEIEGEPKSGGAGALIDGTGGARLLVQVPAYQPTPHAFTKATYGGDWFEGEVEVDRVRVYFRPFAGAADMDGIGGKLRLDSLDVDRSAGSFAMLLTFTETTLPLSDGSSYAVNGQLGVQGVSVD